MGGCCSDNDNNAHDGMPLRTKLERDIMHSDSEYTNDSSTDTSNNENNSNNDNNIKISKNGNVSNDQDNSDYVTLSDMHKDAIIPNAFDNDTTTNDFSNATTNAPTINEGNMENNIDNEDTLPTPLFIDKVINASNNIDTNDDHKLISEIPPEYPRPSITNIPSDDKIEINEDEIVDIKDINRFAFSQTNKQLYETELQKYLTIGYLCWSIFDINNRKYKLKTYKNCFVGNQCIKALFTNAWYIENYVKSIKINSECDCIAIMKKLWEHNIIKHIAGDHEFRNDKLFYIFVDPQTKFQEIRRKLIFKLTTYQSFSELDSIVRDGFNCKDRTYKLSNYWNCFIGSEAIDFMVNKTIGKDRILSQIIGQILMDEGVFEHVERDHYVFRDKKWFYHFKNYDE